MVSIFSLKILTILFWFLLKVEAQVYQKGYLKVQKFADSACSAPLKLREEVYKLSSEVSNDSELKYCVVSDYFDTASLAISTDSKTFTVYKYSNFEKCPYPYFTGPDPDKPDGPEITIDFPPEPNTYTIQNDPNACQSGNIIVSYVPENSPPTPPLDQFVYYM